MHVSFELDSLDIFGLTHMCGLPYEDWTSISQDLFVFRKLVSSKINGGFHVPTKFEWLLSHARYLVHNNVQINKILISNSFRVGSRLTPMFYRYMCSIWVWMRVNIHVKISDPDGTISCNTNIDVHLTIYIYYWDFSLVTYTPLHILWTY